MESARELLKRVQRGEMQPQEATLRVLLDMRDSLVRLETSLGADAAEAREFFEDVRDGMGGMSSDGVCSCGTEGCRIDKRAPGCPRYEGGHDARRLRPRRRRRTPQSEPEPERPRAVDG